MSKKTMLEKVELFRQLVSEIAINKYDQKEFAEIVQAISLEVFTKKNVETLRSISVNE